MTTTALVGPLPTVTFRGGPDAGLPWREQMFRYPRVVYTPPTNTLDPRYRACVDHHVACDCREAEFAEERAEVRYERNLLQSAVDEVLAGHLTDTYDGTTPCQCSGCRIARAAYLRPSTAAER